MLLEDDQFKLKIGVLLRAYLMEVRHWRGRKSRLCCPIGRSYEERLHFLG